MKTWKFVIVFAVISIATISGIVFFGGKGSAQTTPPLDDTEFIATRTVYQNSQLVATKFVGRSLIDGSIWYVETDTNNVEVASRLANQNETSQYLDLENIDAKQNWVNARTVELQQCEADSIAAIGLGNFTAMSNGQQNAVITSLLTCQELNSRVTRKVMNGIFDILIENGLEIN